MRRPYIVITAVVALLALGWTGYWFWIRDRLIAGIEQWQEARRAEGIDVVDAGRSIGGFPMRLEIVVEQPRIARAGMWAWSATRLRVFVQPWNLSHVIVDIGREQTIEWTEAGAARSARLVAERALASTHLSREGQLRSAALDLAAPRLTDNVFGEISAKRAQLHLRANHGETTDRPANSYGLAFQFEDARLPPAADTPLGLDIAALKLVLTLPPPLPPIDRADLDAWRDAGGIINVDRLEVTWGPLDGTANGSIGLDRAMRPLFSFGTEVRGFNATIDAYANAGRLKPNQATGLKLALTALAKPDAKGRPTAQIPIAGQDGRLYVGPLGVANLPPLFPAN